MLVALTIASISFALFVVCIWVFSREQRSQKRFFLPGLRQALDRMLMSISQSIQNGITYIGKYIIKLSWYYSLHTFLRLTLQFLAGIYYFVEKLLHSNRDRARKIRQERKQNSISHLNILVDHQTVNKLSEEQKRKLKERSLNQK
ncbi:MAG: hypothetical protein V4668_04535 [Patescibacteria group bacterium]